MPLTPQRKVARELTCSSEGYKTTSPACFELFLLHQHPLERLEVFGHRYNTSFFPLGCLIVRLALRAEPLCAFLCLDFHSRVKDIQKAVSIFEATT